ncbi:integral membrane protein [Amniculicola lignicola CBS 123094]|uniref:Integral membrane protein n=1 Tax=Amniculicola lignicola CBS 123094 TaxID=1392246 RepID=A0A6A5WV82_9PLEO|nr:integral membrane protein [Amniculicola lignicola CBS 123094]
MEAPVPPSIAKQQLQQDVCVGVSTAMTAVSFLLVALRMYCRGILVHNIGKDDWMMLVAMFFTIGYLVEIYVLRDNGMGFSGLLLQLDQMLALIKTTLAVEITYYIIVYAIKVSILMFYLRIAVNKRFQLACNLTIYFLTVFMVVCVVVCIVQCIPLHKMWDLTGLVQGHCINTTAFFYFTSSFNILTDIFIIALPIKTLLSIQRPGREKFALVFVFGLGVFSTIASIVRLHSIRIYTESTDPFYDAASINLWSQIEVNIGIWCASIPALKALLVAKRNRNGTTAAGSAGYKYHSRDKSGVASAKLGLSTNGSGSKSTRVTDEEYGLSPIEKAITRPIGGVGGIRKETEVEVESQRSGSEERIVGAWGGRV